MDWFDWQLWTTLAAVAVAAFVILRRVRAFVTGRGKSGCDDCPAKSPADSSPEGRVIDEQQIELFYQDPER